MRRTAGWAAFSLPLVSLFLGPWLAFSSPSSGSEPTTFGRRLGGYETAPTAKVARGHRTIPGRRSSACGCRTVDVKLNNFVSNAKVKTGDAKVVNFNVTYVSATYGDTDVDVDQEAEAISGDAVAGQLIGVDARGPGCVNVRVHARNHVDHSTVQSGDATAINRSIVLVDPAVRRGDLEIDVDQEANAFSGDAIAGQVIGITNQGAGRKGCGGVVLDAFNEVLHTKVKTGKATFYNDSVVKTCSIAGCVAELVALLGAGAEVEVCSDSHCRRIEADELPDVLANLGTGSDTESEGTDDDASDDPCPTPAAPGPTAPPAAPGEVQAEATPEPVSDPASTPEPAISPTPSPSPVPVCASPTPRPQKTPELVAPKARPHKTRS